MSAAGEGDWSDFFRMVSEGGFLPRNWTPQVISSMTPDQLHGIVLGSQKDGNVPVPLDRDAIRRTEDAWLRENSPDAQRARALAALEREMRRQTL